MSKQDDIKDKITEILMKHIHKTGVITEVVGNEDGTRFENAIRNLRTCPEYQIDLARDEFDKAFCAYYKQIPIDAEQAINDQYATDDDYDECKADELRHAA